MNVHPKCLMEVFFPQLLLLADNGQHTIKKKLIGRQKKEEQLTLLFCAHITNPPDYQLMWGGREKEEEEEETLATGQCPGGLGCPAVAFHLVYSRPGNFDWLTGVRYIYTTSRCDGVCAVQPKEVKDLQLSFLPSAHTHNSLMDSSFQESAQELFLLPPASTPKIGRKRIERHLMSSSILREFSTSAWKRLRDPRHSFVFFIPQPKKKGKKKIGKMHVTQ